MTTKAVSLTRVRKVFGDFTALREVSFDIADNEFFTLLGPSGCGKTTLLRMIAGFESVSDGSIQLYGEDLGHLPPDKRPVNTVFQNYALFPHMSVQENIGFSLAMLGWSKADSEARVARMVNMVKLEEFVHRKPAQLSGGQQQRVALARAMASRPKVLLLDEPLSALDLKLRQQMRSELKRLQRETGITFVFVTHDQEEALSMSDRIAVMSAGQVQQIGSPSEIYEHPANTFVADFIGETNLLEVTVDANEAGLISCRLPDGARIMAAGPDTVALGQKGHVSLRPERIVLTRDAQDGASLQGTVEDATYLGTDMRYELRLGDSLRLSVRQQNTAGPGAAALTTGDQVFISLAPDAARFLAT